MINVFTINQACFYRFYPYLIYLPTLASGRLPGFLENWTGLVRSIFHWNTKRAQMLFLHVATIAGLQHGYVHDDGGEHGSFNGHRFASSIQAMEHPALCS